MIKLISSTTSYLYKRAFKPVMFKVLPPDNAHTNILIAGSIWQKIPFANKLLAGVWAYKNPTLEQTIDGIRYPNPVGLSAGFDKNIRLLPTLKSVGFGFMTGGSVTYDECDGNPRPWFYRLPKSKSLVVNVGLANEGVKRIRERVQRYPSWKANQFPLTVSVAKTNSQGTCVDAEAIADYVGSLRHLKKQKQISSFEINISCPNTFGGEPFTTPKRLDALLSAIDALQLQKPVVIKMPIDLHWKEFSALLDVIVDHDIRGVTIGNLRKNRSEAKLTDTLPNEVPGNMSGLPTQKLSDDLIRQTYKKYGDRLTIIGVGGIFNAEDAYRKICLGASLVAIVTSMIFEGPQIVGQMNSDLVKLLERDGFASISDAIGSQV